MKYKISLECNETAKENLMPLLKYFKMMGDVGMTREFVINSMDNKWFTFNGDGPDRIENIKVEDLDPK